MDELNVFRRGRRGKCRNRVCTNEQEHSLGLDLAVVGCGLSPLYSETAHSAEERLSSTILSKACLGTAEQWALRCLPEI